jgi:hypothetical protein
LQLNPQDVDMRDLPRVASEVNRSILPKLITCLNPEHKYYVLFDELDRGFSPGDADYGQRLIGLLLAAKTVNGLSRQQGKKLT